MPLAVYLEGDPIRGVFVEDEIRVRCALVAGNLARLARRQHRLARVRADDCESARDAVGDQVERVVVRILVGVADAVTRESDEFVRADVVGLRAGAVGLDQFHRGEASAGERVGEEIQIDLSAQGERDQRVKHRVVHRPEHTFHRRHLRLVVARVLLLSEFPLHMGFAIVGGHGAPPSCAISGLPDQPTG